MWRGLGWVLLVGLVLGVAACGGDEDGDRALQESLLAVADLPRADWEDAGGAGSDLLNLAELLGLTPEAFASADECRPFGVVVERGLIEFAHVPATAAASAAFRTGTLPLTQVLVLHLLALYESRSDAERAGEALAGIFDQTAAAPCLGALVESAVLIRSATAAQSAPVLSVESGRGFGFVVDAVALILPVQARIEIQIVTRGSALALYLVIDYNTPFLESAGQPVLDRLDRRLAERFR